jgi:uncharacterized protein YkwD
MFGDVRLAAAVLVPAAAGALAASARPATAVQQSYLGAINQVRQSHGLARLTFEPALSVGARRHASYLLETNTFEHGSRWWKWVVDAGATGTHVGENLGWCAMSSCPGAEPALLMRMWLKSPEHRRNILDPSFRHLGVGIVDGRFHGWAHAYVVATEFDG